jgi:hypothetical protein
VRNRNHHHFHLIDLKILKIRSMADLLPVDRKIIPESFVEMTLLPRQHRVQMIKRFWFVVHHPVWLARPVLRRTCPKGLWLGG